MVATYGARKYREDTDGKGFEIPDVEDGMYDAEIKEVTDKDFTQLDGSTVSKYMVDWLLDLFDEKGKQVELRQFVKIPTSLIEGGYVHPMSNLYPFLKAIGINPDQEDYEIDPTTWPGIKGRVVVKNVKQEKGKNAGQVRPQITDVMPPAKTAGRPKPAAAPVAAAAADDDF